MKKIFFYLAIVCSVVLLFNIITILTTDWDRLTEYGFGYLTGKIVLLAIFIAVALATRKAVVAK